MKAPAVLADEYLYQSFTASRGIFELRWISNIPASEKKIHLQIIYMSSAGEPITVLPREPGLVHTF